MANIFETFPVKSSSLTRDLVDRTGSKMDVLNQYFESPLHLAVRMARVDVIRCLVQHGASNR